MNKWLERYIILSYIFMFVACVDFGIKIKQKNSIRYEAFHKIEKENWGDRFADFLEKTELTLHEADMKKRESLMMF